MRIAAAILLALAWPAAASEFAAGLGASNSACGTGVPTAWVSYDRDGDDLAAHLKVRTGPDGGCAGQATAVDAGVSRRLALGGPWGLSVAGGYDLRAVPIEYGCAGDAECVALPGKLFRGTEVATVAAEVGVVYDGGPWSLELRYNAVEQDWEKGGGAPPFSLVYGHAIGPVEIDATLMARAVADVAVGWRRGRLRVAASASRNAALLAHPAPAHVEADGRRWARLGGPSTVYALDFGISF